MSDDGEVGLVLIYAFFTVYIILLILVTIFLGINYYRLHQKNRMYPEIFGFLFPFTVNVCDLLCVVRTRTDYLLFSK